MTNYIEAYESMHVRMQGRNEDMVQAIAEHYIGNNPQLPFMFRVFQNNGILQNEQGLYVLDLQARFPLAALGVHAYAAGKVWSDNERSLDLAILCFGPTELYMNGNKLYRSNAVDEVMKDRLVTVPVTFKKGWNYLFLKFKNTAAGFGCAIGAEEAKVRILHVLAPFRERDGRAGWIYTEPVQEDPFADASSLPQLTQSEEASGLIWLPARDWQGAAVRETPFARLFEEGASPPAKAYAWAKLRKGNESGLEVACNLICSGPVKLWRNKDVVWRTEEAGEHQFSLEIASGVHDLVLEVTNTGNGWHTALELAEPNDHCYWEAPHDVHGYDGTWLYIGPFAADIKVTPQQLLRLNKPIPTGSGTYEYWRVDLPAGWVRPYYENAMLSNNWTTSGVSNFARWDYPLGVTMYGLLRAGQLLDRQDMIDYALSHIRICTDYYEYAMWDKEQYGFPSVNHQLVLMKMLDNCGSFGSAMLEAGKLESVDSFTQVAEEIASFIRDKLERREDGAFYRICEGEYSENSMWADDLYMSTPFMRRYYEMTGDESFLDDAAKQFLLYKKYLFMPEEKIMSHVYDFKYDTATQVPWGRGNGWVVFSLSELLEVLPEEHPLRAELLEFFNDLCEGYLALQGDSGLWRQVLGDPEAYEEASCTAMFVYAFARGVTFGWLRNPAAYAAAAMKGWTGLTSRAIDRHGNVYGVCSGSRYSFTPEYYKEELRTVTNDNHGIGIMILAGVEVCRMEHRLTAPR